MRQYVGARYVPKFYNGTNGNEWDGNTVPYEPLVIVTYLGNSYTSKKAVPVGIDITNTNYWVMTGAYNSQITALDAKIDANRVKNWRTKNVAIIGDSWVVGYTENTGTGFVERLQDLNLFKSVTKYCEGGAGYIAVGSQGHTYSDLANDVISAYSSDPQDLDVIMIVGSVNDLSNSAADIATASASVFSMLRTAFPNAEIYVVAAKTHEDNDLEKPETPLKTCITYGCIPLYRPCRLLMGNDYYFTSDGYHIKHDLAVCYANNIVNEMTGIVYLQSDPSHIIKTDAYTFYTDTVTGFALNDTFSGISFNDTLLTFNLIGVSYTSPISPSTETLCKIKTFLMPKVSSAANKLIESSLQTSYGNIPTVSGDLVRVRDRNKLEIYSGIVRNALYQSTFSGSLNIGDTAFTYDRLTLTWYPSHPIDH